MAAFAEEDDVLAGEEGVLEGGDDGVVEALDVGEEGLAGLEALDEVLAQFITDGEDGVASGAEFADGLRSLCHAGSLPAGASVRARCGAGMVLGRGTRPLGRRGLGARSFRLGPERPRLARSGVAGESHHAPEV